MWCRWVKMIRHETFECNKRATEQHDLIIIFMFISWMRREKESGWELWRQINLIIQIENWKCSVNWNTWCLQDHEIWIYVRRITIINIAIKIIVRIILSLSMKVGEWDQKLSLWFPSRGLRQAWSVLMTWTPRRCHLKITENGKRK